MLLKKLELAISQMDAADIAMAGCTLGLIADLWSSIDSYDREVIDLNYLQSPKPVLTNENNQKFYERRFGEDFDLEKVSKIWEKIIKIEVGPGEKRIVNNLK